MITGVGNVVRLARLGRDEVIWGLSFLCGGEVGSPKLRVAALTAGLIAAVIAALVYRLGLPSGRGSHVTDCSFKKAIAR